MHSREITFKDLKGNPVTDTFWFHLSKAELIHFNLTKGKRGLEDLLEEITREQDMSRLIGLFEEIIKMSYGVRMGDKRFVKNDEVFAEFYQTDAYSELFVYLLTNPVGAAEFMRKVIPEDMMTDIPDMDDAPDPANVPKVGPTMGDSAVLARPLDLERAQQTLASTEGAKPIFVVTDETGTNPIHDVDLSKMTREDLLAAFSKMRKDQI